MPATHAGVKVMGQTKKITHRLGMESKEDNSRTVDAVHGWRDRSTAATGRHVKSSLLCDLSRETNRTEFVEA